MKQLLKHDVILACKSAAHGSKRDKCQIKFMQTPRGRQALFNPRHRNGAGGGGGADAPEHVRGHCP